MNSIRETERIVGRTVQHDLAAETEVSRDREFLQDGL